MTKEEVSNLIFETTAEIFENNKDIVENLALKDVIESAVRLSCAANIKLLYKLGIIDKEFKPIK